MSPCPTTVDREPLDADYARAGCHAHGVGLAISDAGVVATRMSTFPRYASGSVCGSPKILIQPKRDSSC